MSGNAHLSLTTCSCQVVGDLRIGRSLPSCRCIFKNVSFIFHMFKMKLVFKLAWIMETATYSGLITKSCLIM